MKLQNKIALITGGSRGIGRGIAERLATEGARIAVNYTKNTEAAQEIVAMFDVAEIHAFKVQGDMSKLEDIERVIATVQEQFGTLDILVNNAGFGDFVPFENATPEHFDSQFDLNVRGLFFTTQHALKIMNDGGRVVNISSIASRGLSIEGAAYGATKAAVNALTSAWSKGLGARGITVNAVSPGVVDTDLARGSFSHEDMERMAKGNAFGRVGQPDDIAGIVAFLCSDDARWITGREIVADGGTI